MSPQEAAAKWAQRAGAAAGDYATGIQRTTVDPGQAAAAKADKWFAGVQASRDKFRQNVSRVSKGEWQQAAIEKGAPRFATGVQQAEGKMGQFLSEFLPFQDSITSRVRAMPDVTPEQRIQRMVEQVRGTAGFRRRGGIAPRGGA